MKWIGWLVKTAISTAIITGVSVIVTWSMVNIYVQQLLKPFQGQQAANPIALTDLIAFLAGSGTGSAADNGGNASTPEKAQSSASTETEQPGTDRNPYDTQDSSDTPASESAPDNALPVMGSIGSGSGNDMYLSTDDLEAKKDSISSEDRMEIFKLLMEKLPPEEIQNISKLLEGGITAEEMQEASDILQDYLEQSEYERLIAILAKY
ncbi:hypothetical protein [Paenibacillus thermotolerans]|uniref:hypothetical protein n=1 Tax=Paenibacillus thermotolerans TaxID=3027807 RepID=UPI0023687A36|nr:MULTISPECIES: hypothetical protein [unclassified Paenibacillus]